MRVRVRTRSAIEGTPKRLVRQGEERTTEAPPLFKDRPRPLQIVFGGLVPFCFGAVVGIVLGISGTTYWLLAILAGVGGFLAGFEHRDGWGGADRGLVGGALFGLGILLAHWAAGTHAKVSLGSFPPLLIVVDAIVGMFLGAAGGRLARAMRDKEAARARSTGDATAVEGDADATAAEGSETTAATQSTHRPAGIS